ncbi:MAG: lipoyl(octanoyl) transferase LipB [Proteobacteria bacterium]|nr:MAG: lipoyl(octanoyl) transferase LipB [Pseudomonadota bacterium]
MSIAIRHLGLLSYGPAQELQQELLAARAEDKIGDTLLVVEHPPVFTFGRKSPGVRENPGGQPKEIAGIPVHLVERGGEVTYHGPGQSILYPIFRLDLMRTGPRVFLRLMEEAVIEVLRRDYDVNAYFIDGKTGVWLHDAEGRERKIASLGIAVRRSVSYHGIAININNDLSPNRLISPCGFTGEVMISLAERLGHPVDLAEWNERLSFEIIGRFGQAMGMAA